MTIPVLSFKSTSRRLLRSACHLCCTTTPDTTRGSLRKTPTQWIHGHELSILRNFNSGRSLAGANLSATFTAPSSSALFYNQHHRCCQKSFGHDIRQFPRLFSENSGGKSTDDIHLPFFGKNSKLPPSSSSILKQDSFELSADEVRLKTALTDYINRHEMGDDNIDEDEERHLLENLQRAYMSLEYWEEALQIEAFKCHMYFVEETDEYADSVHAQGKFYLRQEDFVNSKNLYEEALEYFERTDNSVQRGHVLISLAGWYFFRNQLDESLDCLEQSESMLDSNPALLYKCLDNQGLIYRLWGEFHVALDKYQQALQVVSVDDIDTRSALKMHIADMHLALDESNEALNVYQDLLIELSASTPTSTNPDQQRLGMRGVLLHSIATIHADQGEHELALTEFREALATKQSAGGENNPEVAKTLNSLGALHAGVFDEKHVALEYFQQALLIARIHAEDGENAVNDPDVANALQNISIIKQELAGGRQS